MNYIQKILIRINSDELNKRISKALIYGVGGAVGSRILLMLTTIIIARVLGEELFGKYSLINSTVQLFVIFAGVGIGVTLNRYTALYYKSNKIKAGQTIGSLYLIAALLSISLVIIVFFMAESISLWITNTVELKYYFQITAFTLLFTSLASMEQNILQGMEEYKKNAIIQLLTFSLFFIFSLLFVLLMGLEGAIIALLITQLVNFILLRRSVRKLLNLNNIVLNINFDKEVKSAIVNFTIPAFISNIFVFPVTWVGNIILVKNSGFVEMAIFTVVLQWFTIMTYLPNQLSQVRPIYTDYYARNKKVELKNTLLKLTGYSTSFVFFIAIVILVFGRSILSMYGQSYVDSYITFAVMIITSVILTLQSQVGILIQASGKMWIGFFLNIIWAAILLISFYFLKDLGAFGYSMAYFISYTVHTINSYVVLIILLKGMETSGESITTR